MIIFPNLAMAACDWIRSQLELFTAEPWRGALVTAQWDDGVDPKTSWSVVVRADPPTDGSAVSQDATIGVTCFGPRGASEPDEIRCERLAQHVAGILRECATPGPDNPFAACTGVTGPHRVPSGSGRPCYYLASDLVVIGTVVNI